MIVLWDGRGIAIDGKPYENTYAFFLEMRDGKPSRPKGPTGYGEPGILAL